MRTRRYPSGDIPAAISQRRYPSKCRRRSSLHPGADLPTPERQTEHARGWGSAARGRDRARNYHRRSGPVQPVAACDFPAFAVWAVVRGLVHQLSFTLVYVPVLISGLALRFRPRVVVSAGGIRRPWCLRSVIGRDDVQSVLAREPGAPFARIRLRNEKTVTLDGVSAAQSAAVAALGGKHVATAPRPALPPPTAPRVPAAPHRAGCRRGRRPAGRRPGGGMAANGDGRQVIPAGRQHRHGAMS